MLGGMGELVHDFVQQFAAAALQEQYFGNAAEAGELGLEVLQGLEHLVAQLGTGLGDVQRVGGFGQFGVDGLEGALAALGGQDFVGFFQRGDQGVDLVDLPVGRGVGADGFELGQGGSGLGSLTKASWLSATAFRVSSRRTQVGTWVL